jgi:alcohol dehydrogenase class IV
VLAGVERDFTFRDGERLIRFGAGALAEAPRLLADRGFDAYALLTTERAQEMGPRLVENADAVLHVPGGAVPQAAAAVRPLVAGRPIVALGGGRVVDSAKAIAGADGLDCAVLPTTLSGAELTGFHRMPEGAQGGRLVRPSIVISDPRLMASQPMPALAASAMNGLAHAVEALYTPLANPMASAAALRSAALFGSGLADERPDRESLALAATLAGWASGSAGYAVHHVVCQTIVRIAGTPHAKTNAVVLPHSVALMEGRCPVAIGALASALGDPDGNPTAAAALVRTLVSRAGAGRLRELGMTEDDIDPVVESVLGRAELANTPDPPDALELRAMLHAAL